MTAKAAWRWLSRFAWTLPILALAGALVCAGQILLWSSMGAWPYHDTVTYWLGGRHILEGQPVYGGSSGFLQFLYAPPWAVLWAGLAVLPVEVGTAGLFILQVLALRYVCGSWRNAGLVAWLPIVPRELTSGNVDLIIAASICAALTNVRGSGYLVALMAVTKWSPAAVLVGCSRDRWKEAVLGGIVLVAITLPWFGLWEPYIRLVAGGVGPGEVIVPLVVRIPISLALLAYRRPWSVAAGSALLTPAFYFHSLVLLLPAARLATNGVRHGHSIDSSSRTKVTPTILPVASSTPTSG